MDRAPDNLEFVSLQGEGEPVLNKAVWKMAGIVKQRSISTYTITNAAYRLSHPLCEMIDAHFNRIGVSLDTINKQFADRVGRYNLPLTLATLEQLIERLGPERIDIYTVALSRKSVDEVSRFVKRFEGVNHIIQPIQSKDDYQINYRVNVRPSDHTYQCRYLDNDIMRFFNIEGIEMPCCYIKDRTRYTSLAHTRSLLADKTIPDCCSGCRELDVRNEATVTPG